MLSDFRRLSYCIEAYRNGLCGHSLSLSAACIAFHHAYLLNECGVLDSQGPYHVSMVYEWSERPFPTPCMDMSPK